MAVWSIVKKSELEGALRLDAEYYRPEYLKLKHLLSKHPPLSQCVEKIIHPVEVKRVYEDRGLHILLAQNIQHNFLEFSVTVFMPESVRMSISRNKLLPNDVVMTRSGANYGDSAPYFGEPAPIYACADDLVIRPKPDLLAGYLATFFNTSAGRAIIKRGGYGAGQPHVAPPFLKALRIPRFSLDVEKNIDVLARATTDSLKLSESLYRQAEEMLLKELGLDRLNLSQPRYYTVKLSKARELHRLDAEHFQPKYDKLIRHLMKTFKTKALGEITSYIKRGVQPRYIDNGEVFVINSRYVGKQLINTDQAERTDAAFWEENTRARVKRCDVIMNSTGWGTIGRTNCVLHEENTIVDNHVTIIRVREGDCNPIYLAVYLNSKPGLMQTDKWLSGSSGQVEIYPTDIARFVVPVLPQSFQEKIANLVTESHQARQKAKALLEEAKQKVEAMIEGRN